MRKIIIGAVVLLGTAHVHAELNSGLQGKLHVHKVMEMKVKSKKLILEEGTYSADIQKKYRGFFVSKQVLDLKIQTPSALHSARIDFEKKSETLLKNQTFAVKDISTREEEVISGEITERRQCVLHRYYTEENCRMEYRCELGNFNCDITDPPGRLVCDTVVNEIKGEHNFTYKKAILTSQRKLSFVDRADGGLIATLEDPVKSYNTEIKISETRCQ